MFQQNLKFAQKLMMLNFLCHSGRISMAQTGCAHIYKSRKENTK